MFVTKMKDAMIDLDELRSELADFAQPERKGKHSARDERIIAGFEEIQRFVEHYGRAPQCGEDTEIFERILAVRLDRLREVSEHRILLSSIDRQGVLLADKKFVRTDSADSMNEDELLTELANIADQSDITTLRHVRTFADKRAAEEIENREVCEDFDRFELLFEGVRQELKLGVRKSRSFQNDAKEMDVVEKNTFFIIGGQIAYIAEIGDEFMTQYDRRDSRLRVIFDNGTQSRILLRSFQRALHRDLAARLISDPDAGPLFSDTWEDGDVESGTIYVLRSNSIHPFVVEHRELIHKIGVTGGKVETRIANAPYDATYLLAEVEVVATYRLVDVKRTKLENIFHRIFAPAQLDLTIHDRFGHPVKPREWFLVPLNLIDEAVKRILDGSITDLVYDPKTVKLVSI